MTQNGINTILDMEKPMVSRSEHEPKKRVDLHKGTPHMHFYGYTWNVMAVMGKYQGYYGAIFLPALWDLGVSENVVYPQLWQFD